MSSEDSPSHFIPGLELCRRYYEETVGPILAAAYPGLPYAAALIGPGSEVLGFDDEMSTDHDWGPRTQLFLREADHRRLAGEIRVLLARELPYEFLGYPTNFGEPLDKNNITRLLVAIDSGPVNHRVQCYTVRGYFLDMVGIDIDKRMEAADWLATSEQLLLSITAGAVYHDAIGLEEVRTRFTYYPHDVWLYLLAAAWERIGQEEHLMGRAGIMGDEIGSALIAARLARDIMRLSFLMERRYAPYPKWFGRAFNQLAPAPRLKPLLRQILRAGAWQERDLALAQAYGIVAAMHNALGLTEPLPEEPLQFHERPFQVMAERGFAAALRAKIGDPAVGRIAARPLIGGIDQFSDSTDLLSTPFWRPWLKKLYE